MTGRIASLGPARFPSPRTRAVSDELFVPARIVGSGAPPAEGETWELAGPREKIFFDPRTLRAAVVTCGGLCPGLNNVLRSLYLHLFHHYGVREILGVRYGYGGLAPETLHPPIPITSSTVDRIHRLGGTVLGTSRGPVPVEDMLATLQRLEIGALFCVGGDGTLHGAHEIARAAQREKLPLAVVGIPKTIDNDIACVTRSFGFRTAVEAAREVLDSAHSEAKSVHNGISVVKLMGRQAGFLAAEASIASQDVNFVLVPEVPFALEGERGFLAALEKRLEIGGHALIAVAEGAGQDLLGEKGDRRDASGNLVLGDIGPFLRDRIREHLRARGVPHTLRYIEPSYSIRSRPANSEDAILCDQLARRAADAAMAGKTDLVVASVHDMLVHVPLEAVAGRRQCLQESGEIWLAALACTGQAARFT